jgi:hypothetical protein
MFEYAGAGEQGRTEHSPGRSCLVDCEFLNDRICQQFGGQFGHPNRRLACRKRGFRTGYLDFEALALADRDHLSEPEPVTSTGDGLALRVVDLGLEHDVDNYLGHSTQSTADLHLTGAQERRVLSQRNRTTDDRPPASRRAA